MMKPNRRRRERPNSSPPAGPRPNPARGGGPGKPRPRGRAGDDSPTMREHPQYGTRIPPEELEFMKQQAAERARERRERQGGPGAPRPYAPRPYSPRPGGGGPRGPGGMSRGPGGMSRGPGGMSRGPGGMSRAPRGPGAGPYRGDRDRFQGPPDRDRHGRGPAPARPLRGDRGPATGRPDRGPMPGRPDRGTRFPDRERPPAKPYRTGVQSAGEGPPRPSPAPEEPPLSKIRSMVYGYQQTAVLMAAYSLGVFAEIHKRPQVAADVARHCQADPRGIEILLEALVAAGVIHRHGSTYVIPRDHAAYLVPGADGDATGLIEMAFELYPAWGDLARGIREGTPRLPLTSDAILGGDPDRVRRYIRGVHTVSRESSRRVAEMAPLLPGSSLLDVAGGSGIFSAEYARRTPNLKATLFDLPPTLEVARDILTAEGCEDLIEFRPGDYRSDPFPGPVDTILLSNVFQTESEENALHIIRKAWEALVPGGTLLVHGVMSESEGPPSRETTFFSLQMFVVFNEGRSWSADKISEWLSQERFGVRAVRPLGAPFASKLILATRLE